MIFGRKRGITHRLGMVDLVRLSLRIFKTKPARTFLTILGMAVGIGTVLFLISLGYGLQYILIGKLVTTEDSLRSLEIFYPPEAELNISYDDLRKIKELPEAEEISPVAEFIGEIKFGELSGFGLIKIIRPNYFRLSGVIPDIGSSFNEEEASIVVSSQAIKLINLPVNESSLNKEFSFKVFYQKEREVEVEEVILREPLVLKGIIEDDLQPPFVLLPANFLPKDPPSFKTAFVKAKDIEMVEKLRDKLIEKGFVISARIDLVKQARKIMNIITTVLGIFGITALIVSAIGMFNTMIVGFLERIYEVGIIKSLGATDKDVRNLFLMESMIMGLLGGLGGIALGMGAGKIFNFGLNLLAQRLGGKPFELFITPPWFLGVIIVTSIFIGIISGFWPAKRAAQLSPKEAFLRK